MSKKLIVLFTVILLLVPFASVNAQSASEFDFCQDLTSSADCDILTRSGEAMSAVSSLAFDMSLVYDITSDMQGMENVTFELYGDGQLAIDLGAFNELQSLAYTDSQAYMEQAPAMMSALFNGIEGELFLTFDLSGVTEVAETGMSTMPFNLLMKDGTIYMDVGALMGMSGQSTDEPMWFGFELDGFMDQMSGGMMGGFNFADLSNTGMFANIGDVQKAQEYITITRLADSEIMGMPVAVYESTYNIADMMQNPEFQSAMESMADEMSGMGEEQSSMFTAIFDAMSNMTLVARQYIGLDDFLVHRFEMDVNANMNMSAIADMAGSSSGTDMSDLAGIGDMQIGYVLTINLNEFNQPVNIEVPEDAQIIPTEMMGNMGF